MLMNNDISIFTKKLCFKFLATAKNIFNERLLWHCIILIHEKGEQPTEWKIMEDLKNRICWEKPAKQKTKNIS